MSRPGVHAQGKGGPQPPGKGLAAPPRVFCCTPVYIGWVYPYRVGSRCIHCGQVFESNLAPSKGQFKGQPARAANGAKGASQYQHQSQRRSAMQPASQRQPQTSYADVAAGRVRPPSQLQNQAGKPLKEQGRVAQARAEVTFFAQAYGEASEEFERAMAKLKKVKNEELQAKPLGAQVRSLQDQIQSQKAKWVRAYQEQEWITDEVKRLEARYRQIEATNDALGDEVEEMEVQLETLHTFSGTTAGRTVPARGPTWPSLSRCRIRRRPLAPAVHSGHKA